MSLLVYTTSSCRRSLFGCALRSLIPQVSSVVHYGVLQLCSCIGSSSNLLAISRVSCFWPVGCDSFCLYCVRGMLIVLDAIVDYIALAVGASCLWKGNVEQLYLFVFERVRCRNKEVSLSWLMYLLLLQQHCSLNLFLYCLRHPLCLAQGQEVRLCCCLLEILSRTLPFANYFCLSLTSSWLNAGTKIILLWRVQVTKR